MHTHWIDVLDAADDHAIVGLVAHDLEFVFLPSGDGALDEDLRNRRCRQASDGDGPEVVVVVGDTGTRPAKDVARSHDDRPADLGRYRHGLVDVVGEARLRNGDPDALHRLLEPLTVLRRFDGQGIRTDHLDAVLFEDATLVELHRQVERRLTAEGRKQRVGPFFGDDRFDHVGVERLDVGGVSEIRVGHDRGRIRVRQDDPVALLFQHPTCLGAGVVELARLTDDDRTGPDDQDRMDVSALGHQAKAFVAGPEGLACTRVSSASKSSKSVSLSWGPGPASG